MEKVKKIYASVLEDRLPVEIHNFLGSSTHWFLVDNNDGVVAEVSIVGVFRP